ncbi:MAG TPA: hypothetical protein VIN76_03665, partial [Parasphingorhabdus sp.]
LPFQATGVLPMITLMPLPFDKSALEPAISAETFDFHHGQAVLVVERREGDKLRARLEQFIGNYPELFEEVRGRTVRVFLVVN